MNIYIQIKEVGKGCFIAFILFILYIIFIAIHEYYWKSDIIFYSYIKILLIFITVFWISTIFMYTKYIKKFVHLSTIILASIIFFLTAYSFNLTFPVLIDRSLSVYLLGTLSRYNTIDIDKFEKIIAISYNDRRQFDKRLAEQLATGSIIIDDNNKTVTITKKGKYLVNVNVFIGKLFNLDLDNINPGSEK